MNIDQERIIINATTPNGKVVFLGELYGFSDQLNAMSADRILEIISFSTKYKRKQK